MAKIYELGAYQPNTQAPVDSPVSHNQEILARLQAMQEAYETPEARLVSELRGMEETLLANHRQYVRLWEAADRLGITPPVRTAEQIVREADVPQGLSPLPPSLSSYTDAPVAESQSPAPAPPQPWPSEIAEANRQKPAGMEQGKDTGNSHENDAGYSM
jgi:hypothetical protein